MGYTTLGWGCNQEGSEDDCETQRLQGLDRFEYLQHRDLLLGISAVRDCAASCAEPRELQMRCRALEQSWETAEPLPLGLHVQPQGDQRHLQAQAEQKLEAQVLDSKLSPRNVRGCWYHSK